MPLIRKTRAVQYPLASEATFNLVDTMMAVDGTVRAFNATGALSLFEMVPLPPNAIVIGGDVTVETASDDTGTATVSVGDSLSAARYLAATSIKAVGRTPLVPTGFRGNGEDIRLTFANQNGNATVGRVSVRVTYVVTGRSNEVQHS